MVFEGWIQVCRTWGKKYLLLHGNKWFNLNYKMAIKL